MIATGDQMVDMHLRDRFSQGFLGADFAISCIEEMHDLLDELREGAIQMVPF